jgi:hypothetical protein
MPDWIDACWAVVALLALAAAYNHRWHHARDQHPTARLTRASTQTDGVAVRTSEPARVREEVAR